MPIRIDPEEEKRLTILRNRVSISESKREVLETEYLSLRAHYVHESHKLRRAKDGFTGQLKLLRDLVLKRGEALAMYRVRYAVANDILHSLEYRSEMLDRLEHGVGDGGVEGEIEDGVEGEIEGKGESEGATAMDVDAKPVYTNDATTISTSNSGSSTEPTPMEGVIEQPPQPTAQPTDKDEKKNKDVKKNKDEKKNKDVKKKKDEKKKTTTIPEDLTDIYERIESQLHEAELACANNIETPEELLLMKAALAADALALEAATEKVSMGSSGSCGSGGGSTSGINASGSGGSGSLFQQHGEENDSANAGESGSGENGTGNTTGGGTSGENSTTSTSGKKKHDKSSKNNKDAEDGSTTKNSSASDSAGNGNKKTLNGDGDSNVIPWNCPVMPRTPYDVAILLSNLSTTPDCSVAFACGDTEGRQSNSLLWLESNLPSSQNGEMDKEEEKLQKVREDVRLLQEELSQQIEANSDLQRDIIKGRKRRDQLCSMMSMIRSETEAVIERYEKIT